MMLSIGEHGAWLPPIVKTVASREEGIDGVLAEIERHREHLAASGEIERRRRSHLRLRVETILKERVVAAADRVLGVDREVERGHQQKTDPYRVADRLFAGVLEDAREEGREEEALAAEATEDGPAGATEERMA
jgi:LAO/AO transport system kinase